MKRRINYGKAPFNGWSKWNPNNAKCLKCDSTNLNFHWVNGEVKAIECLDCDAYEHDEK